MNPPTFAQFMEDNRLKPVDPFERSLRARTIAYAAHVRLAAMERGPDVDPSRPTPRPTSFQAFRLRARSRNAVGMLDNALIAMPRAKNHGIGAKAFADIIMATSMSRIGNEYLDVGFTPIARTRRYRETFSPGLEPQVGDRILRDLVRDVATLSDLDEREPKVKPQMRDAIALIPEDALRPAALEFCKNGGGRGTLLCDHDQIALERMGRWWETQVLDLVAAHCRPKAEYGAKPVISPVETIPLEEARSATLQASRPFRKRAARARILTFLGQIGDTDDVAALIPA